jgi:hypothetical protein
MYPPEEAMHPPEKAMSKLCTLQRKPCLAMHPPGKNHAIFTKIHAKHEPSKKKKKKTSPTMHHPDKAMPIHVPS